MPVGAGWCRSVPVGAGLVTAQSGQGRSVPVGAGLGRSVPVGAGAGTGCPRCRPVPVPLTDRKKCCKLQNVELTKLGRHNFKLGLYWENF